MTETERIAPEELVGKLREETEFLFGYDGLVLLLHSAADHIEPLQGALRELVEAIEGRKAVMAAGARNVIGIASPSLMHAAGERVDRALAAAHVVLSPESELDRQLRETDVDDNHTEDLQRCPNCGHVRGAQEQGTPLPFCDDSFHLETKQ